MLIKIARFGILNFLVLVTVGIGLMSGTVLAIDPINKGADGVAIKGFDPVAYFTQGKPTKGLSEFQYEWMGVKWYFSSAVNRELFIANPGRYSPRYGGYCAYAVSKGHTADISPSAWKIVDGKLYLNNGWVAEKLWKLNIPENIEKADKNWPKIQGQ